MPIKDQQRKGPELIFMKLKHCQAICILKNNKMEVHKAAGKEEK